MKRLATLGFVMAAAALTAAAQLTITTQTLPAAVYNQPYTPFTLTTAGDPGPVLWSFAVGAPPPQGFGVGSGSTNTTGSFCYGTSNPSGPPSCLDTNVLTPVGTYTAIIQAKSGNQTATQQYSFAVINPLQILTNSPLPNAIAGKPYSTQIQTLGGTGQFVWSILSGGGLPPGITLDPVTGTIAGTAPAVNANYSFTVQLQDQGTQPTTILTRAFTIAVVGGINTVAILTQALPDAIQGQLYAPPDGQGFQLTATGNNLVWSVIAANPLPPTFNLSPSGLLTGFGASLGIAVVRIQVMDAQAPSTAISQLFTLRTTLGPLGIVESALPAAIPNTPYSVTLTPTGGIPGYTWALDVPSPQGLTIDPNTGVLSGTLSTVGSFPVTVKLSDCASPSICTARTIIQPFTLKVVSTTLSITNASLLPFSPGTNYVDTLTASGGTPPYTWSVTTGTLPAGLGLNALSGQITGISTAQTPSTFTIQVTDSAKPTATTATKIFTISPALAITTSSLPGAGLGQLYSRNLAAAGGVAPLTWSVASGNLPPGLNLDPSSGVIAGTPTSLGNFTFGILVTDAGTGSARKNFTINVANPVVIGSGNLSGSVGTAFSQTLAASGGTPPYTWSVTSGTLPPGLQLNNDTINGTPTGGGTSQVGFTATDVNGLTGSKTIAIAITQPAAPPTSIALGTTTQPAVSLSIGTPYPLDITGTLTLTFASSAGGTDDMVRFSDGTRSLNYIVRASTTQATFPTATNPAILTGTVAGTITLTANLLAGGQNITPSPAPAKTITIDPAVPVINSVTLQQVTGGLNVVVTGYSNTREVSSGSFTFTVSSGNTLSQAQFTVPLTTAYATWFNSTSANATGGQFKLTVPFSVTQGAAAAITKVSVTLTNSKGASAAVGSP